MWHTAEASLHCRSCGCCAAMAGQAAASTRTARGRVLVTRACARHPGAFNCAACTQGQQQGNCGCDGMRVGGWSAWFPARHARRTRRHLVTLCARVGCVKRCARSGSVVWQSRGLAVQRRSRPQTSVMGEPSGHTSSRASHTSHAPSSLTQNCAGDPWWVQSRQLTGTRDWGCTGAGHAPITHHSRTHARGCDGDLPLAVSKASMTMLRPPPGVAGPTLDVQVRHSCWRRPGGPARVRA
jgi:hypothetical protein